jgi:hypothetical protein
VFKLDRTDVTYDSSDPMAPRRLTSITDKFPTRSCDLTFTPLYQLDDGPNLLLIAFVQSLAYGVYSGKCEIDGKVLEINEMFGMMEFVSTRI